MKWVPGGRGVGTTPVDAALVEAARGAPAAFYQFCLSPSGTYSMPFASVDFTARFGIEPREPEEMAALYLSRIHPDDLPSVNDAIARSARTFETFESEFRVRLASGDEAWVEARSNPRPMPDGGVMWDGVVTDITVRRAAESALRQREKEFRAVLDTLQDMYFRTDLDGRFMMLSPSSATMFGYASTEELIGQPSRVLFEDPGERDRVIDEIRETGFIRDRIVLCRRKDGSSFWISLNAQPWLDDQGHPAGMEGAARDITARMDSEAALRGSEERYRRLFVANPQPMWFFDTETLAFLEVNEAAVACYGFRRDEFLAMTIADIRPPEDVPRLREAVGRVAEGAIDQAGPWTHRKKDGSIIRVEITSHAVEYLGRPAEVVLAHDITARMNAEATLRVSEEQFRVMFELAPVGVAQTDPATGRFLTVNPRMCLITGYRADELLTMRVPEITHPEDRDRDWELFQNVVKGNAPEYRIEKRYVRKDGSIAWVNVNMVVLRDAAGQPTWTVETIEDITERKKTEENVVRLNSELEDALEWQRQIFEGSRDAVFLSDREGRFVAVNHAATELTGFAREELLLMKIPDLHDEADLAAYRTFHGRILDGERILSEAPIRRKDGTKVAVEFNNSVVVIGGRRLVHTAGRNITERNKAAEALSASDTRYRVLFENAAEGIIAIDPDTRRFQFFNPALCAMFGYSPEEFGRLTIRDIHPKEALAKVIEQIRETSAGTLTTPAGVPCLKKDGTAFVAEVRGSVVELEGRKVIFGFFTDVTERVRLEEQLRQAQKMEAIGQLAGGVAHDFNNLLTVISGNTELLLSDAGADDPKRGALTDIRTASARAASLTRQLLAFSRKQILEPKLVDLHVALSGIEKMLRRLIGEDVELATDLAADSSWVKVDPGQLDQVVMNLALNARDAMPRGGRITIHTRNLDAAKPTRLEEGTTGLRLPPKVAISVSDTGTGISSEVKAHIFEPFFTTKAFGKGTGLGLSTVYGIVKQSGGDITVESEPGKGATFTIVLPSHPAPRQRNGSRSSLGALPHGTETVLVVEDEDAVRRIVKITLESTGYRVIEARSGFEALETGRWQGEAIRLVITDVVMPEMGGRELAERLAEDHPGVKILYMSGYTDDAVMRHGIVDSGVAFLQKPFSPLALAQKVREVLDSGAPEPPPGPASPPALPLKPRTSK